MRLVGLEAAGSLAAPDLAAGPQLRRGMGDRSIRLLPERSGPGAETDPGPEIGALGRARVQEHTSSPAGCGWGLPAVT